MLRSLRERTLLAMADFEPSRIVPTSEEERPQESELDMTNIFFDINRTKTHKQIYIIWDTCSLVEETRVIL